MAFLVKLYKLQILHFMILVIKRYLHNQHIFGPIKFSSVVAMHYVFQNDTKPTGNCAPYLKKPMERGEYEKS